MPDLIGSLMFEDINSQPKTLEAVFDGFFYQINALDRLDLLSWFKGGVVFTGCGSTYALGLSVAAFGRSKGFLSSALPASEINFYPDSIPEGTSVLVAFSRSGETSETLWAINSFRRHHPQGKLIVITTSPNSSLAKLADLILSETSAKDSSIIETRSFTAMYLLAQFFFEWVVGNELRLESFNSLPGHMRRLLPIIRQVSERIGRNLSITRFFFLGSGPMFGIAYQAAFTMKECTGQWAEAFHPLEFRHGPRTAANFESIVILFVMDSQDVGREEIRVLKEMKEQGAHIHAIFDKNTYQSSSFLDSWDFIELESGLGDLERIFLSLPFTQYLAYYRALTMGLDPDNPTNLYAVTRL